MLLNLPPRQVFLFLGEKKKKSKRTNLFKVVDFVQFREFVQLDVACSTKQMQATQICAVSSTASEARFFDPERQPQRELRRPLAQTARGTPPKIKAVADPVFPSCVASQAT